jgi:hypothetical protein
MGTEDSPVCVANSDHSRDAAHNSVAFCETTPIQGTISDCHHPLGHAVCRVCPLKRLAHVFGDAARIPSAHRHGEAAGDTTSTDLRSRRRHPRGGHVTSPGSLPRLYLWTASPHLRVSGRLSIVWASTAKLHPSCGPGCSRFEIRPFLQRRPAHAANLHQSR